MDVIYNRLKKQVEQRHGDVTFDKLGSIVVTCMEFVEHNISDISGPEKEAWVIEAVDKIWYEQTQRHITSTEKKKKEGDDATQGDIEDLVRQMIQQVCIATKGAIQINVACELKKVTSVRNKGFSIKRKPTYQKSSNSDNTN